jgi:hypothetical protein
MLEHNVSLSSLNFVVSFVANFVESLFFPWSNLPTKLRTKLATKFNYCLGKSSCIFVALSAVNSNGGIIHGATLHV